MVLQNGPLGLGPIGLALFLAHASPSCSRRHGQARRGTGEGGKSDNIQCVTWRYGLYLPAELPRPDYYSII